MLRFGNRVKRILNLFTQFIITGGNKLSGKRSSNISSCSTISTNAIVNIVDRLKTERVRKSTRANYYGIWRSFNEFFIKLKFIKPNSWEERLVLFAGYLADDGKKGLYYQKLCLGY